MRKLYIMVILCIASGSAYAQKSPLTFQTIDDTVFHSVVGRVTLSGDGFKNTSLRDIRIWNSYFLHQADSIFILDQNFDSTGFVLQSQSVTGFGFRFCAPHFADTIHDTLITVCEYVDDPGNEIYYRRPYVGYTTTDSSFDTARVCVFGHDCITLTPVKFGDTAFGILCYELEFIPVDTISITGIHFAGPDSASFHLVDSTFPRRGAGIVSFSNEIRIPYYFTPAKPGKLRYSAVAMATMTSSDRIFCHESDIQVTGFTSVPLQDTIAINLNNSDTLPLSFTLDSSVFSHVLTFWNTSSTAIKVDNAFLQPSNCYGLDFHYPEYGTRIPIGKGFVLTLHYIGDSTGAGGNCSDTLYLSEEGVQSIRTFAIHRGNPQAAVAPFPNEPFALTLNPNPSDGSVNIETSAKNPSATLEIYDILGNLVARHSGPQWTWNAIGTNGTSVPNGIYIVRMSSKGRAISERLVIER